MKKLFTVITALCLACVSIHAKDGWVREYIIGDELLGTNNHYIYRYQKDSLLMSVSSDDDGILILQTKVGLFNYENAGDGALSGWGLLRTLVGFYSEDKELVFKFEENFILEKLNPFAAILPDKDKARDIVSYLKNRKGYVRFYTKMLSLDEKTKDIFDLSVPCNPDLKEKPN